MDSRSDIKKMRNDKFLKVQGEAIALGIVEYFGLQAKSLPKPIVSTPSEVKGVSKLEVYKKDAQPSKSLEEEFAEAVAEGLTDGAYPLRPMSREEGAVIALRVLKACRK